MPGKIKKVVKSAHNTDSQYQILVKEYLNSCGVESFRKLTPEQQNRFFETLTSRWASLKEKQRRDKVVNAARRFFSSISVSQLPVESELTSDQKLAEARKFFADLPSQIEPKKTEAKSSRIFQNYSAFGVARWRMSLLDYLIHKKADEDMVMRRLSTPVVDGGSPLHMHVINGSSNMLIAYFQLLTRMVVAGISPHKMMSYLLTAKCKSTGMSPLTHMFLTTRAEARLARDYLIFEMTVRGVDANALIPGTEFDKKHSCKF